MQRKLIEIESELVLSTKTKFQDKFNFYMAKIYGGNYTPIKPQGSIGDRKVDGLLNKEKIFFQVYAPERVNTRKTNNKIDEDFNGFMTHVNQV
ncbi:hypothetical protein C8C77_1488 [Halanaerobium saccharolyticum]|uniref:Uncharacterized protein n=1 Tax=Halanaerobium saccharolyticum TaxID=43595 RepID=A0A4R7YNS7_9FIRM|nr:hypothetical protein [Halanaerobium saccharolyticum]RAK03977.1 hypothetical protein C7958_1438 [Halanaerobium saccharolyticum]TDV97324.1 hypothetical protein C8C77_1488 [Halanaerobium saccharolyticum]TDX49096.1 hypothetical protein C7956_1478 [Halanaerobium saccharolyticum]